MELFDNNEATRLEKTKERVQSLVDEYCEGNLSEFARRAGLIKQSASQYASGKVAPSRSTAYKIGTAFRVNPLWVMGLADQRELTSPKKSGTATTAYYHRDPLNPSMISLEIEGFMLQSNDEIKLITAYRGLEPAQKEMIRRMLGL